MTNEIVKKCNTCGAEYTLTEFRELKGLGIQDMREIDSEEPTFLEYRDCTCKSTLALGLDKCGSV